jgi:predicted nucleotidyltransferase
MTLPQDFKEFLELLNANKVRYLIVGGYAVSYYSRPKFTNDIDVWIDNSETNAEKVLKVLTEFGFEDLDIDKEDLFNPNMIIQLGYAPIRIDLLMGIKQLKFAEAYRHRTKGQYLGAKADFISLKDLIKNKKACGRDKDLLDLKWLKKYSKK